MFTAKRHSIKNKVPSNTGMLKFACHSTQSMAKQTDFRKQAISMQRSISTDPKNLKGFDSSFAIVDKQDRRYGSSNVHSGENSQNFQRSRAQSHKINLSGSQNIYESQNQIYYEQNSNRKEKMYVSKQARKSQGCALSTPLNNRKSLKKSIQNEKREKSLDAKMLQKSRSNSVKNLDNFNNQNQSLYENHQNPLTSSGNLTYFPATNASIFNSNSKNNLLNLDYGLDEKTVSQTCNIISFSSSKSNIKNFNRSDRKSSSKQRESQENNYKDLRQSTDRSLIQRTLSRENLDDTAKKIGKIYDRIRHPVDAKNNNSMSYNDQKMFNSRANKHKKSSLARARSKSITDLLDKEVPTISNQDLMQNFKEFLCLGNYLFILK